MPRLQPTICTICNCECGLLAEVQDGRVQRVIGDPADPHNRGALCPKGKLSPSWSRAPDRLTHPLIRRDKSGRLVRASWEEALDLTADRLSRIRDEHGPAAVAFYHGANPNFLSRVFYDALARWFGSPNTMGTWSLCVGPKVIGSESVIGAAGSFPRADFINARLIVLWGTNPAQTAMHRYWRLWPDILAARRRGARLTVIDPRPTRTARAADRHLAIKPGTDHLLAVALIKLLLDGGLVNRRYLESHAEGLERLTAALSGFDPLAATASTGLAWPAVEQLAEELGTARPAVVERREGIIHQRNGTRISRAIAVINALIGGIDVSGGLVFGVEPDLRTDLGVPDRRREPPLWARRFRLAKDAAALIPEAILSGSPRPVRGLIVACGNPVSAWPQPMHTKAALKRLDWLVVNELFPTETTTLADVVLPGATFYEKGGMSCGPFRLGCWIRTFSPLAAAPEEARPEWRTAAELAARLGCPHLAVYRNEDQVLGRILSDSGLTGLDPRILRRGRMLRQYKPGKYLEGGFPTPSGRLTLFEDAYGRPELTGWLEARDDCPPQPEYPFRLITGARTAAFYHSQQRNVKRLRSYMPEPFAEISPQTAAEIGVRNGQEVVVSTPHGRLRLPVAITAGMAEATVSVQHGWPGPDNANLLIGAAELEPAAGTPIYRAVACRVEAVGAARRR